MSPVRAAAIAGLTGFAVMSLELAAVRILAPYFGDSAYVWTNVIGVMLAALALGAWIGGRLADPELGTARLGRLLLAAGLLAALIPLLARPLGQWLLPADLALDAATSALVRGSLATTLLIFAPPVLAVGAATPMLVACLAGARYPVGRASALVAAGSTIGSLIGTFLTTHTLVPGIGSRATIWLCAGILLGCAALCRGRPAALALIILPAGLWLLPLLNEIASSTVAVSSVDGTRDTIDVIVSSIVAESSIL